VAKKHINKILRITILVTSMLVCSSWGFLVHRSNTQLAIYYLPKPLQNFYYTQAQALVNGSVQPDLRRKTDSTEATKHFIDLDCPMYKGRSIPNSWEAVIKKYGSKKVLKEGTLPWQIKKTYLNLIKALKEQNSERIVLESADLAHYLADATVPLHTTQNYDGQLTNQTDLHELWETLCPQLFIEEYMLYENKPIKTISNIETTIWNTLRESEKMLPAIYHAEKQASIEIGNKAKYSIQTRSIQNGTDTKEVKKYTAEFAKIFHKNFGESIQKRLRYSAWLIASFWYTAWVTAGKPNLAKLYIEPSNSQLQNEITSWQNNTLIKNGLLRAKNGNK
jgi:hypothetical protein